MVVGDYKGKVYGEGLDERLSWANKKIDFKEMLYTIAFCFFFAPEPYAVKKPVLLAWRMMICIVSMVAIISYLRRKRMSGHWVSLTLFVLFYYLLSSFVNKSDTNWILVLFYSVDVIGFITVLDYCLYYDFERSLRAFIAAGIIMCGVHYVTFLLYRDVPFGMRNAELSAVKYRLEDGIWFFLKHDNGSVFYFIPVLSALWYYVCEYRRLHRTALICSALTLYMYWSQWSVAAMILSTVLICLYLYIYYSKEQVVIPIPSFRMSVLIGFAVCGLLVYGVINPNRFIYWFSSTVNRDVTFSGRSIIWPRAIEAIRTSPVFGLGCESDALTILRIGINHTHNMILQVLYTGGIVTMIPLLFGLLHCEVQTSTKSKFLSKGQMCLSLSALFIIILSSVDWYLYLPVQFASFIIYRNSRLRMSESSS